VTLYRAGRKALGKRRRGERILSRKTWIPGFGGIYGPNLHLFRGWAYFSGQVTCERESFRRFSNGMA